jgi:sentrin-specific protease 1
MVLTNSPWPDVLPWTRRVDLSAMDMVLLPVNVDESHWALMAAYPRYHVVQYFDSLGLDGTRALKVFRGYLVKEGRMRGRGDTTPWALYIGKCPRQPNAEDCGVFALKNMEMLMQGKPLAYEPQDGVAYRSDVLGNVKRHMVP